MASHRRFQFRTPRVGAEPHNRFEAADHVVPALSVDHTFNEEELRAFDERVRRGLGGPETVEYVVKPRLDGVAILLRYEDGMLTPTVPTPLAQGYRDHPTRQSMGDLSVPINHASIGQI